MSFYMTLPCDSSREFFPENRIGKFTTVLAREVNLETDYEVGLSECVIPPTLRPLNVKQAIYWQEWNETSSFGEGHFEMDAAAISTIIDLQEEIDWSKTSEGKPVFTSTLKDKKILLTIEKNCGIRFDDQSDIVAGIFGFEVKITLGSTVKYTLAWALKQSSAEDP